MPKRTARPREVETRLGELIANLRTRHGWSYEQLAERMTAAGCKIHPSGIQRTEKEGRRITVEELVGYAQVFDTTVESLIFAEAGPMRTKEYWRDLLAAERLQEIRGRVEGSYWEVIRGIQIEASRNPELARAVRSRLKQYTEMSRGRAQEQAAHDGIDVSTEDKLHDYIREWFDNPSMIVCRDIIARGEE